MKNKINLTILKWLKCYKEILKNNNIQIVKGWNSKESISSLSINSIKISEKSKKLSIKYTCNKNIN